MTISAATLAEYKAALVLVHNAVENADYTAARSYLLRARVISGALPYALTADGVSFSYSDREKTLDSLEKGLDRLERRVDGPYEERSVWTL